MKNDFFLRNNVRIVACGFFLCIILNGCGIADEAIVIPIGETVETGVSKEVLSETSAEEKEEIQSLIYVYVCGAVVCPGVVKIPDGSRAEDALLEAGGFTEDAQTDYVNLAAKVSDGEKLYFPSVEEAEKLEASEEAKRQGLVNINTATVEQLMTLPGIGESRARDIIAYREEYGAFQRKEDLQKVSGIKENMYQKLCDLIVVE